MLYGNTVKKLSLQAMFKGDGDGNDRGVFQRILEGMAFPRLTSLQIMLLPMSKGYYNGLDSTTWQCRGHLKRLTIMAFAQTE
eukprot:14763-Eustigmatos_ZCMA.PRE.1